MSICKVGPKFFLSPLKIIGHSPALDFEFPEKPFTKKIQKVIENSSNENFSFDGISINSPLFIKIEEPSPYTGGPLSILEFEC